MQPQPFDLTAPDGTTLRGRRWVAEEASTRAVVVIAHGMAEHGERYARFADALTGAGFAVYAADHRGHGRTAEGGTLGYFAESDGWNRVTDDIDTVVTHASAEHPNAPIVLFGHSMGSLLARTYAVRHGERLTALVLSGTPADAGTLGLVGSKVAAAEARLRGAKHPSKLLDKLSFGAFNKAFKPARTDFDWLSRDDAEVDAYVADDKCGFIATAGFYVDMLGGLRLVNTPSFVAATPAKLPILVVSGDADPAGGDGRGVEAAAAMLREGGVEDVTLMLYPGARHELLNETNRDDVTAHVLAWIEARLPHDA